MMITDAITYNVHERGRKHRGVNRNFDCAALASMINGPEVQERVKHGDMLGYYGHWPRLKLGMNPSEGGIVDGAVANIVPALRTVSLSAAPDGTITHKAQFLDTEPGEIASRLYASKAGGFSSAIDAIPRTSPAVPKGFYGFDYVLEPNYSTNRGHKIVLDGVGDDSMALLDHVLSHAAAGEDVLMMLLDSLQLQHSQALQTLARVHAENETLLSRLARARPGQVLDSALMEDVGAYRPSLYKPASVEDMRRFRDEPLAAISQGVAIDSPEAASTRASLERVYGARGRI